MCVYINKELLGGLHTSWTHACDTSSYIIIFGIMFYTGTRESHLVLDCSAPMRHKARRRSCLTARVLSAGKNQNCASLVVGRLCSVRTEAFRIGQMRASVHYEPEQSCPGETCWHAWAGTLSNPDLYMYANEAR